jgi:cobyrinic acid a,c-diamide synthase
MNAGQGSETMSGNCPRLVIAATASGLGKTSLTLGLVRALGQQGLRVQTFKVGPDFLDPTYLALASGRTCYNLDGWMTSRDYLGRLFARATAAADVAVIEGVMGLFDGAEATRLEGSTAEIAHWLDAPVLLLVHAWGAARSFAATVYGFNHFEPSVRIAGVVANHVGSPGHATLLAESLAGAGLPPLLGAVPRGALPALPSRHLGLVTADPTHCDAQLLDQLADAIRERLELPRLLDLASSSGATGSLPARASAALADRPPVAPVLKPNRDSIVPTRSAPPLTMLEATIESRVEGGTATKPTGCNPWASPSVNRSLTNTGLNSHSERNTCHVRLGIARDAAFHFYYPDNLETLEALGVDLVPFSPLDDHALPVDLDGLYFGGGYPEVYAQRLAANRAMREAVCRFAASGRLVYAECGGLMYLSRGLDGLDGQKFPMAGVLPVDTAMRSKFKTLGYAEVLLTGDAPWGPAGATCRGHEFHYSEITADESRSSGWRAVYAVRSRRGEVCGEGFCNGSVLASYVHLHWASRPAVARHLVSHMSRTSMKESP